MTSIKDGYNHLELTGILENLTFSASEVWAWYIVSIPEEDYGVLPEEAGLPVFFRKCLVELQEQNPKKLLDFHMLVSTYEVGVSPTVAVGVKLGNRIDKGENFLPKSVDKFINLLADAPLTDYISEKDFDYWNSKAIPYNKHFGSNLGFFIAKANELAYVLRKKFYPAMSIPDLHREAELKEQWGEQHIAEIAKGVISTHPKYLKILQDIRGQTVTGYRSGIEIFKLSEEVTFPEFEAWLPYVKTFPYKVDFSIRFTVNNGNYENLMVRLSTEASTVEELYESAEDLVHHYNKDRVMISAWTSGDQLALLNESIPNGKNYDSDQRSKTSELSLKRIHGNISFSKTDVYVWMKIPLVQFEYLDDRSKENLSYNVDLALGSLVISDEKSVECHMIIQGSPFDAENWVKELYNKTAYDIPLPYNREYLSKMFNHVNDSDFRERAVLLGINVGRRSNFNPRRNAGDGIFSNLLNMIPQPIESEVSDKEISYWTPIAKQITYQLGTSRVKAEAAKASEIAFAIQKNFFPEMLLPSPKELEIGMGLDWKEEEVDYLAESAIENNSKYLKITQTIDGEEYVGYRATLCFAKFPEVMYFPEGEPWIHYASLLPFPTDFSLRFTLEPARKVRKEVGNKLKEIVDQAVNMEQAGGATSIEISERIESGEELEYTLKKDGSPWVYGRYRITVEADTVEELKDRAKQIIDLYREIEIHVKWPTGDQLALFKEGLPNDRVRSKAYYQRHVLSGISAGIPTGAGTAGDQIILNPKGEEKGWLGPYIGYTTGQTEEAIFLSMHSTIDTNHANGCVITGSPGSGKTFLALTLAYQSVLAGVWTIFIDPKADAEGMVKLPGMENANVLNLRDGNVGILDPFSIGTGLPQQTELAIEVIYLFLGGADKVTQEQQVQLSGAVSNITRFREPSLGKIVDYLTKNPDPAAKSLGVKLEMVSKLPFSQLCFSKAEDTTLPLRPEDGLTVLTLLGLDLPAADMPRENYTNANRLAVGVMYLLSSFTRELMMSADKGHAKAIIIDEAWAITSTQQGKKLVNEVARMGRAHNTALFLISQNAEDFNGESVTNSVSTRLVFRANDDKAIDNALTFLALEHSDSNRDTIRNLSNGECLMKDWSGRIAKMQVDSWNDEMFRAFDTNPASKK